MVFVPDLQCKYARLADAAIRHGRYAAGTIGGKALLAIVDPPADKMEGVKAPALQCPCCGRVVYFFKWGMCDAK
jgi:hypothetical protein